MSYTPNPADPTRPTGSDLAGNMAYEFQALKAYIQSLILNGTNFSYTGSFRNRLRNGTFNVFQRNLGTNSITAVAGTPVYTLDGWQVLATAQNATVSQVFQTYAASYNLPSMQVVCGAGTTALAYSQKLESVDCEFFCANQNFTLTGLVNIDNVASGGTATLTIDTPTVADNWAATTVVYGPTAFFITGPNNNPNYFKITGQLSAHCFNGLRATITYTSPQGRTYKFSLHQFEIGALASPFEFRPQQTELALCQRYFWEVSGIGSSNQFAAVYSSGGSLAVGLMAPVAMTPVGSPTLITNLADGTFGSPPGAGQWGVGAAGVVWGTKTGTVTVTLDSTTTYGTTLLLAIFGATYTGNPNTVSIGTGIYIAVSKDL